MRSHGPRACVLACSLGLALAGATSVAGTPVRANRPAARSASTATSGRSSPTTASPATVRTRSSARPSSTSTRAKARSLEDGVIVPGQRRREPARRDGSRIRDPDERMPPPDSGHALTAAQIALLRRWIDEGAKWDTHWAYIAADPARAAGDEATRHGRAIRSTSSSSRASSAKGSSRRPKPTRRRCCAA